MSGIRTLLTKLGIDQGIEIDPDEFESLGLSEDEVAVDLDDVLPGRAAGTVELFLDTPAGSAEEVEGLIWEPIAREGQWALRPDGKGGKRRVPLKIVAGRSKNQRREIGLQDVVDAFDDEAIEHVTIPENHDNKPTENHGYIKALKVVAGKFKGKPANFLMGAYDFTEPATKEKVKRGSIPSRSAGFLYDYERTDTGKKYPVVLEHVALTPKPWLRGMPRFGRALEASDDLPVATLTLSNEGPSDVEYTEALAEDVEEGDFLATTTTLLWPQEESPEWLKGQVNAILDAKRAEQRARTRSSPMYVEEDRPYYRCKDAKPSEALICDGYGDGANHWIAPISVKDGQVELSEYTKWQSVDQAWVADSIDQSNDDTSLSEDIEIVLTDLELAQATREARARGEKVDLAHLTAKKRNKLPAQVFAIPEEKKFPIHDEAHARNALSRASGTKYESRVRAAVKKRYPKINVQGKSSGKSNNSEPPRGGGNMAEDSTSTLQLSDEARRLIQAAEDRAKAAEQKADKLSQTVDGLLGTANASRADAFILELKGMGLDEEHGFSGMLNEIHKIMLEDDGGPALQADHFADDKNTTGELTLSDCFRRVFGALKTADGVTLKLGEIVTPTGEVLDDDDKDGKDPGKPGKGDKVIDEANLSDEDLLRLQEKDHPGVLAKAGIKLSDNGGGDK